MPASANRGLDRRMAVLLIGGGIASAVMSGCRGAQTPSGGDGQEETPRSVSSSSPQEAVDEAVRLLDDAQQALDDEFGGLTWREDPSTPAPKNADGTCDRSVPGRICDDYLAKDSADDQRIADALNSALAAHGLPQALAVGGGTGGWATTSSSADGITFEFRSKGITELSVSVAVAGDCAEVSDGG
jgi:hypothetical protein